MNDAILQAREIRRQRYLAHKKKQAKEGYIKLLSELGYAPNVIESIIENKIIEKIQAFFREFRLSDKYCVNQDDIFGQNPDDIVRVRIIRDVYGYHYLQWLKHFDTYGYCDPKTRSDINYLQLRRINKYIKEKNKFRVTSKSSYENLQCVYHGSYNKGWEFEDFMFLLETRGTQQLAVKQEMFSKMLNLEPSVYAIEVITNDNVNINRSYCTFSDFPSQQEVLSFPIGVYHQLKISPNETDFRIRIIQPEKGTRVKLKCFINSDTCFENLKVQMTKEISKHRILSLNQIICIETDKDHSVIPFLVTELFPNNIIDITNVDLEIDFDECFPYDNVMEALFIYFSS